MFHDAPPTLNTSQMARRLRVSPAWLKAEAEAGRILAIDAGRTFLFTSAAVDACLLERAAASDVGAAHDA